MTSSPPPGRSVLGEPGLAAALALFQQGAALSRADVAALTGWARVTVTARLERLLDAGLLLAQEERVNGRGRPATIHRLNASAGALLVADVGASGMRVARCDLAGMVEDVAELDSEIADGPDAVLATVREGWRRLLPDGEPWGAALSLPGPIAYPSGLVVDPPIMTGWNGFDARSALSRWHPGAATMVENDVNAMAVGEVAAAAEGGRHLTDLLVVKVGTGVGAGIVSGGHVIRGAAGAAGDIGHTEADVAGLREDRPPCRCGKVACVEAYAGGWALVRDARARGLEAEDLGGFLTHLVAGHPVARQLTADAGRVLGSAIATAVSLVNPEQVLVGGSLGLAGDALVAGVRERVYARSLPLATRSLRIGPSVLGHDAGVRGLAHELSRQVLLGS
ncbi:ROK family transcriptional regulator [Nocardioides marmoribigeumensis]|uniref:NBD/HSP70 family sugar kinase n=1 Tax=Nocardioides marmoribigeumensis TaxID=433649 RepID=A0ABU2BRG8_9ACTN|nr:ROK family protein [Nocardioides marmoribigeumensis]MDR7360866.1 putative NBD/HSP70 family sugar kinase [Nocardioides marmoribigeumensis]